MEKFWISGGLAALFILGGCGVTADLPDSNPGEAGVALVLPTAAALAPTLALAGPVMTLTPIPTTSATSDLPPTNTPAASPAPTTAPLATPIDRSCPDPEPVKPDYNRFHLGEVAWPESRQGVPGERLWLDKPLPGGGRFLINAQYPYGYDAMGSYLLHNGVDSAAPMATPLLAVGDGTVVVAQKDQESLFGWRCDWYGQLVVIELDQRWQGQPVFALYGHVLNIAVAVGDRVAAGEQIAEVGFGGAAIVPHLHFELRVGENRFDATRNPMLWIRPPETRGIIAGRLLDPTGRPWQGVWLKAVSLTDADTEYVTWTYLDDPRHLANPDEILAENFVFSDLLPGKYRLYIQVQEINYQADVEVRGGEISAVEVITGPFVPPEPESGSGG